MEPKHKDAAMEMRLMDLRKRPSEDPGAPRGKAARAAKGGGILSRLFKK